MATGPELIDAEIEAFHSDVEPARWMPNRQRAERP